MKFSVVMGKESRHPQSESELSMTSNIVHNIMVHTGGDWDVGGELS